MNEHKISEAMYEKPNIDTTYKKLSPKDKALLDYAFECDETAFILFGGNSFIGVNVNGDTFIKEIENGVWSMGYIKELRKDEWFQTGEINEGHPTE